jgi:hypothetical protein
VLLLFATLLPIGMCSIYGPLLGHCPAAQNVTIFCAGLDEDIELLTHLVEGNNLRA